MTSLTLPDPRVRADLGVPKEGEPKGRPIGMPATEDKLLQRGTVMLLKPIYEQEFLDCSYGYRPGRSAHDALEALWRQGMNSSVRWIVELDIKKFFGLRLEQYSGSRSTASAEPTVLAAPGRGLRRARILIMDDDVLVREVMGRQLAVLGFDVVAFAEGQRAVSAFQQAREAGRPFDAVILDLLVDDGWGGEQTLEELLRIDSGVRAMVCSGSLSGSPTDYEKKGFCGVLPKPYAMAALRDMVEAVLPSARSL